MTSHERLLVLLHYKADSQEDPAATRSASTDVAFTLTVLWIYICTALSYSLGSMRKLQRRYTSIRPFFFTQLEECEERRKWDRLELEKDSLACLRELLADTALSTP